MTRRVGVGLTSATAFLTKGGRPLGTSVDAPCTVSALYHSPGEVQCAHTHTPCNVAEARHGWDRKGNLHCSIQRPPAVDPNESRPGEGGQFSPVTEGRGTLASPGK